MMLLENIRLALYGLKSNKMRALLTMLGIIIGIASVIAIMTVGNSLTVELNEEFASMGATNIEVLVTRKFIEEEEDNSDGGFYSYTEVSYKAPEDKDYISTDMLREYVNTYEDKIDAISVYEQVGSTQVTDEKLYANINILGINLGWLKSQKKDLLGGRLFTDRELKQGSNVCLVSGQFVNNMYGGDIAAALGQDVLVELGNKSYAFNIVGVYEYKVSTYYFERTSEKDMQTDFYIPVRTAKEMLHTENYAQVTVLGKPGVDVNEFMEQTRVFFNKYYEKNRDFEIMAYNMTDYMDSMNDALSKITIAIAVIAGIALLVGGIGVMNIMLVSITERTREIGTRKALGAPNSSIRIQFIVESIVICLIGGLIGIFLGILMGYAGMKLMSSDAFAVSPLSVILSISFSMSIGVFFGFYPANKAAKMDPIEALRYE